MSSNVHDMVQWQLLKSYKTTRLKSCYLIGICIQSHHFKLELAHTSTEVAVYILST